MSYRDSNDRDDDEQTDDHGHPRLAGRPKLLWEANSVDEALERLREEEST